MNAARSYQQPKPRPAQSAGGSSKFYDWKFSAIPDAALDLIERGCFMDGGTQRDVHTWIARLAYYGPAADRLATDDGLGPLARIHLEKLAEKCHCKFRMVFNAIDDAVKAGIIERRNIDGENWYRVRPDQYAAVVPWEARKNAQIEQKPKPAPAPRQSDTLVQFVGDRQLVPLRAAVEQVLSESGERTAFTTRLIDARQTLVLLPRDTPESAAPETQAVCTAVHTVSLQLVDSKRSPKIDHTTLATRLADAAADISRDTRRPQIVTPSLIAKLHPLLPTVAHLDALLSLSAARTWNSRMDLGVWVAMAREDVPAALKSIRTAPPPAPPPFDTPEELAALAEIERQEAEERDAKAHANPKRDR